MITFSRPLRAPRVVAVLTSAAGIFALFLVASLYNADQTLVPWHRTWGSGSAQSGERTHADLEISGVETDAQLFVNSPVHPPYKEQFGEVGRRAGEIRKWLHLAEGSTDPSKTRHLLRAVEKGVQALFPFLRNPKSETPLADLRGSFRRERGIVIPTGSGTLRYACHLIASLQDVLGTSLPIEIAYAGDEDLPATDRELLRKRFKDLRFLDVLSGFADPDGLLGLKDGGWAIKPFAALASSFEEVIVADADAVFLQPPETMFSEGVYKATGTLLFHDRLLWQHAYKDRHQWWKSQITHPSATLNKSLVWTEDYAEEGDSGVVVLNKLRADVLVGLLHVSWQNTQPVRDEVTYKLTYGDKESWWFGFELTGSPYEFEEHYGTMIGYLLNGTDEAKICSFVIGHLDQQETLLWYNGGLLKNKQVDSKLYEVPTHWMVDGKWIKGSDRKHMSCMVGQEPLALSTDEAAILTKSTKLAKDIDAEFSFG